MYGLQPGYVSLVNQRAPEMIYTHFNEPYFSFPLKKKKEIEIFVVYKGMKVSQREELTTLRRDSKKGKCPKQDCFRDKQSFPFKPSAKQKFRYSSQE